MTSYATVNESSSTSSSGATTVTSNTQQQRHQEEEEEEQQHPIYAATTTKGMQREQDQEEHQYQNHHNRDMQETPHIQHDCSDCECDSLSDGKEKADMTPENVKKIDDIIEQELEMERSKTQQQQQQQRNVASITAAVSSVDEVSENSLTLNSIESDGVDSCALEDTDETNEKFFCTKNPALSSEKEARLINSGIAAEDSQPTGSPNQSSADTMYTTTPAARTSKTTKAARLAMASPMTTGPEETGTETETETETDGGNSKRSCAFTLSFDNNDVNAAAATAARYKSVMERFQSRHRRGVSMSKLDSGNSGGENPPMAASLTGEGLSLNSSSSASPLNLFSVDKSKHKSSNAAAGEESTVPQVKLRPRDPSTSRVRDAAKRHSWSPRSSTSELSAVPTPSPAPSATRQAQQRPPTSVRRSTATAKSIPPPTLTPAATPPLLPKGAANLLANRTQQFTPRSTAMQLALQKIDFLCPQAPLGDFEHTLHGDGDGDGDGDDVSEAGTYTLDGDNYTEEQKDLMNIDKNLRGGRKQHKNGHNNHHHHHHRQQHSKKHDEFVSGGCGASDSTPATVTPTIATKIPVRTSNVLEVNYFHNEADDPGTTNNDEYYATPQLKSSKKAQSDFLLGNHPSAGAYLEQIKSHVLRRHAEPTANEDEDVGCFTSVTTSGVLAMQGALDPRPKLSTRKNSLTTSQIDSSEYVSNEVKLKSASSGNHGGSYTDIQKAEYRLNLFTNQKDLNKYAATRNLIETPPETPVVTADRLPSDTAALTMAQTKNDWIQQWARNARARSLASDTCVGKHQPQQHQQQQPQQQVKANAMTRSYNCGGTSSSVVGGSLTDDSLYSHQLNAINRYRGSDNEFDYSSDPSLLTSVAYAKSQTQATDLNGNASVKPPKSPSKIPSPLHSIGRTRSVSRNRCSLQGLMTPTTMKTATAQGSDLDDDGQDIFLKKTEAAINSLQQSLSRKNSLKSPPGSSPRMSMNKARIHQMALQSNEDGESPHRSIDSDGFQTTQRNDRNVANERAMHSQTQAQLMTSSFNEQQLKLLTSGEYLIKHMRMRKNSFDGNMCSPSRRRSEQQPRGNASSGKNATSPQHRGKVNNTGLQQRAGRPQFQNIYTPPAARHGYGPLAQLFPNQQQHQVHTTNQQQQLIMKKSASSNNFGQAYNDYDDNLEYYINDADDDEGDLGLENEDGEDDELEYGEYDYSDINEEYGPRTITLQAATIDDAPAMAPLTSTRYNKALLMRIERSKQRAAAAANGKPASAPAGSKSALINVAGLVACPNTPELTRRNVKSAPRSSVRNARQSVPRDASLSRLASQVPNSLASAKRQLLQTAAAANQRVQPKYLDISKYKPAQGNPFLRKNEAKSTLKAPSSSGDIAGGIRRSPSSSGLSRNDPSRASNASIRSTMTSSCTGSIGGGTSSGNSYGNVQRAFSAARRDDSVSKQKEIEMAMWKRRSTYDPLKAAAEDRRRKEEAKRLAMAKNADAPCESTSETSNG